MTTRPDEMSYIPDGHIPALDGIRGIAVLMVIVFHCSMVPAHENLSASADAWYKALAQTGWIGVDLFFVLSGFLITGILLKTQSATNYFRAFYARRSLRIFPLYYGFLAAMIFGLIPLAKATADSTNLLNPILTQMGDLESKQAWFWLYASNFYTFVTDGEKAVNGMGHFWSLAIEEQYYLVWTPLVFFLNPKRLAIACILLILSITALRAWFVLSGRPPYITATFTPTRVDTIIFGSLGACLLYQGIPTKLCALMRKSIIPLWILAFAAQIAQGSEFSSTQWSQIGTPTVFAIIFTMTVIAIATTDTTKPSKLHNLLTLKPLIHLGMISYGLYVFHVPLRGALLPIYQRVVPQNLIAGSQLHWTLGFVILCFIGTLVIAQCSWWFFESPILKLKKRFRYQYATEPEPK